MLESTDPEVLLRELMARIHRDGGQRQAQFATLTEAALDCDRIVAGYIAAFHSRPFDYGKPDWCPKCNETIDPVTCPECNTALEPTINRTS